MSADVAPNSDIYIFNTVQLKWIVCWASLTFSILNEENSEQQTIEVNFPFTYNSIVCKGSISIKNEMLLS